MKKKGMRLYSILILFSFLFFDCSEIIWAKKIPQSSRSIRAITKVKPKLEKELKQKKLHYGSAIFIRIFKKSNELEVWIQKKKKFVLFKNYSICSFSGKLGPKQKTGDWQSPEGFYFVNAQRMNPWSQFHLSFNVGYPNQYDRFYKRTGSALMVHGNCVSIGCYAMTDKKIEEIYALADGALRGGQKFFRVHIFPFRLTQKNLQKFKDSKWISFWKNLKQGYDWFERTLVPPNVHVKNGIYIFQ
ncbi:MAG: murein L,D-transpeptidase YafK [bacterium]|jgi:murein L,D-transpeptidase YafK